MQMKPARCRTTRLATPWIRSMRLPWTTVLVSFVLVCRPRSGVHRAEVRSGMAVRAGRDTRSMHEGEGGLASTNGTETAKRGETVRLGHDAGGVRDSGGDSASLAVDTTETVRAHDGGTARPCTTDADCREPGRRGRCFTEALDAQYTQAFRDCPEGRAWREAHRPGTCVFDECNDRNGPGEDGCGPGRRCGTLDMVPFPQRVCVVAECTSDRQCRRQAGGRCASYLAGGRCVPGGWACSYPSDPCAPRDPHRMCPVRPGVLSFCAPRGGRFQCVEQPAVP